MKICTTCKKEKEITEFNKNSSKKNGLNNICRNCSNIRSKKYYKENKEKHLDTVIHRREKAKNISKDYLLELFKNSECKDCGNKDIRVMEFDHISNNKRRDISQLVSGGWSLEVIKEEIKKCEIVCCNCHRIRTFTRKKNYRIF